MGTLLGIEKCKGADASPPLETVPRGSKIASCYPDGRAPTSSEVDPPGHADRTRLVRPRESWMGKRGAENRAEGTIRLTAARSVSHPTLNNHLGYRFTKRCGCGS